MFRCQPDSAWAATNLAESARQVGNVTEFPNQNQQNIVSNQTCHPVDRRHANQISLRTCGATEPGILELKTIPAVPLWSECMLGSMCAPFFDSPRVPPIDYHQTRGMDGRP